MHNKCFDCKTYTYAECTPLIKASMDGIGVSGKIPCPKLAIYRVLPKFDTILCARSTISS